MGAPITSSSIINTDDIGDSRGGYPFLDNTNNLPLVGGEPGTCSAKPHPAVASTELDIKFFNSVPGVRGARLSAQNPRAAPATCCFIVLAGLARLCLEQKKCRGGAGGGNGGTVVTTALAAPDTDIMKEEAGHQPSDIKNKCYKRHLLRRTRADGAFVCDVCEAPIAEGINMMYCGKCDYSVCFTCHR